VGPSTPCWLVRDDASGATAVAPVLHGGPHALWLGDVSPESLRRERILGETAAPALAAALRATGPVDVYARCAEALLAGDDGHARTSGLSLILLRDLLPALAGRAAHAVHAVALLAPGDGLGLSAAVGAARATLAGASGAPASSLLTCVAGDGEGVAVQLAGMPGRWFSARGAPPVDGSGRALAHVGDAALVELVGLGAATAAAAVPLGPGGAPEGAVAAAARAAEVAGVALERSRRFAPPGLDGDGAPLGVDARACLDLRTAPSMAQPALARVHGAEPAVRLLRVPLGALSDALSSLIYGLEG